MDPYLEKVIDYHKGALFLLAAPPSWGITEIFKIIFEGSEKKDLIMPLVVVGVGLILFMLLYSIDFVLGVHASRKVNENITLKKIGRSFWKFFSVVIIMFCMTIFSFLFISLSLDTFYMGCLLIMLTIMIVILLYEFQSIGKHLKTIYDNKPKIFVLLEDSANAVEKGLIKKIQNLFN